MFLTRILNQLFARIMTALMDLVLNCSIGCKYLLFHVFLFLIVALEIVLLALSQLKFHQYFLHPIRNIE